MEVIIKLPEERFRYFQRLASVLSEMGGVQKAEQFIANGIILPRGHGRLINAEQPVTVTIYDKEHSEKQDKIMTVEEFLEKFTNEGCPPMYSNSEPKTGRWIEDAPTYYKAINEKGGGVDENTDYFTDDIACSECLAKFNVFDNCTELFNYCPNCGAKMEE